jgi:hypothetical protein
MSALPSSTERRSTVAIGTAAVGATSLLLGVLMVATPGDFFDRIGPFGTRNSHYIRDVATWQLAFGAALVVAVRRPGWRVALLAFGLLQTGLHTVNHLIDVGKADPGWVGPADAIALAALTAAFAWLLVGAVREERLR